MLIEHRGARPTVDESAYVSPAAVIGAEVRIHGVVQVNTRVSAGTVVPIRWVAVGDPAQLFSVIDG